MLKIKPKFNEQFAGELVEIIDDHPEAMEHFAKAVENAGFKNGFLKAGAAIFTGYALGELVSFVAFKFKK